MPRRHSILDDLITLPWWFNLILAGIAYALLKIWVPTIEFQSPVFRGVALALPILASVITAMLVLVAIVSAIHAWRKGELLNKQTSVASVKQLPWRDFEYLVGEAYRRKGYKVHENNGAGPDGGVDLSISKDGETLLVQCKNWRTKPVGVSIVRELLGVVVAEGASGGIVTCSGRFTPEAIDFARSNPIELVGGAELVRLIGDVQLQKKVKSEDHASSCPKCGGHMIVRRARKGKNAGISFWGCKRYPKCRGTRSMSR